MTGASRPEADRDRQGGRRPPGGFRLERPDVAGRGIYIDSYVPPKRYLTGDGR